MPTPTVFTPDAVIRDAWTKAGGSFYGPHVEHADMVYEKWLPFMRMLFDAIAMANAELEAGHFWKGVYPKGWTAKRVANEMTDFNMVLDGLAELYGHITGGKASKPNTDKSVIRELFEDHVTELVEEALAERDVEIARLTAWVNDLQSGMYVNCVYCGHRYGPAETTPVSMADALKAHVEACEHHPMSALKVKLDAAQQAVDDYQLALNNRQHGDVAANRAMRELRAIFPGKEGQ